MKRDAMPIAACLGVEHNDLGVDETSPRAYELRGPKDHAIAWLERNLRHTTGELLMVHVQGDSMSPTLIDGEAIIVDRGLCRVGVDGVYAFRHHDAIVVKRVQQLIDGSLTLISDNLRYQPQTIPRSWVPGIEVVGRMVWPPSR